MSEASIVYVVDDDEAVRDSIGMLLDSAGLRYRTFADADALLTADENLTEGCLVLDIRMPGMSGLELQAELKRREISLPIIFITGHGDIPMAVEAMRQGAVDFIRKPFRDQELLDRINEALVLEAQSRDHLARIEAMRDKVARLTPRETEVFERVANGQANKVIAIDLEISERTVEIHRSQVMHKTGARSLADLVKLRLGIGDAE